MSVQFDQSPNRWVVRWYEAGRHRSRRFELEREARVFEAERTSTASRAREAVAADAQHELHALQARLAALSAPPIAAIHPHPHLLNNNSEAP